MKLNFLKNKKILITGGTGSIGSSLVLKLFNSNCNVVRVMSNDENGLYELSKRLNSKGFNNFNFFDSMEKKKIRFFLGDIRDYKRCKEVTNGVDIVIHAAALKHVSICEYNPSEVFQTNVVGTNNMLRASINNKVSKFLFISTDKVVSPTNIMGLSKLKAEKISINANYFKNNKSTKISCIRFGNVLGSRGSVIPNFVSLLKNKKNIYVTDKKMTRFVMSLNEATNLILKSIKVMKGKEIFILKSMNCFKIYELANALVQHFNKINKKKNIVKFSKKLSSEKFDEELFSKQEIPFINISQNMFIIKRYKNKKINKKIINNLEKFRISNFNFMSKIKIINYLKKIKLI